jgi:hypothetical protein
MTSTTTPNEIIIRNENIIEYFNANCIDPEKFIALAIEKNKMIIPSTIHSSSHPPVAVEFDNSKFIDEYNSFMNHKKTLSNMLKENTRYLEQIQFEYLDSYYYKKVGKKNDMFLCENCNIHSFKNKKALSVHKRKCLSPNEMDGGKSEELPLVVVDESVVDET